MRFDRIRTLALILVAAALIAGVATAAPGVTQHWTQNQWPVFVQTQPTWEGSSVQEPTVLYKNGRFQMWFTSGAGDVCALGYAESKDGVTWTAHKGPIRGYHQADGMRACHNSVIRTTTGYRLYYSTAGSHGVANGVVTDPDIWTATSKDGIHFGTGTIALHATDAAWSLSNTAVFSDGVGHWYMLADGLRKDGSGVWGTHLAEASSPAGPFTILPDSDQRLAPLQINGGTFGAPWVIHENGLFKLWYLATDTPGSVLPTDIYYSQSSDLRSWTTPQLVVGRDESWERDQVADPSVVETPKGTFMYFSGLWNRTNPTFDVLGGIGMAKLS